MGFYTSNCRWGSPAFLNSIRFSVGTILLTLFLGVIFVPGSFAENNTPEPQAGDIDELINTTLAELREQLAPDPRLDLFEVEGQMVDGLLKLTGWVTDGDISDKVKYRFHVELGFDLHQDSRLRHFPDYTVFGHHWGIVNVPLANMSAKPHPVVKSSHRVNQLIMGTVVKIIRYHENGYAQVQGPDDYLGWINKGDILEVGDGRKISWEKNARHIIGKPAVEVDGSRLYFGTKVILRLDKPKGKVLVELPNGKGIYIERDVLRGLSRAGSALPPGQVSVCRLAKEFLGTGYMWGGVSADGIDCSGLVQLVYWWHGIQIPRDCSQQIRMAEPVEKIDDLQPGDIMIFGNTETGKINHCAIALGNKEFIHSQGKRGVVIDSYNPDATNFNAELKGKYITSGRFLSEKMYIK